MLLPGATLGMLGGGQLGRMFVLAARNLGYRVVVLEPDPGSPAGQLAEEHIIAAYDDQVALMEMGEKCDAITTEFENIPAHVLHDLSQYCPVYPKADALEKAQNRIVEKEFITSCGLLPVPYGAIKTQSDIAKAVQQVSFPAIVKTARLGYDGKGQLIVNSQVEVEAAYQELQQVDCVLEQRIDLDCEISVILARNNQGKTVCFPVAENLHVNGVLHQSRVPAAVSDSISTAAQAAAKRMADKLDYVGVLAVEFFVTKKGELLVNEMAPRTHNSGHYSLDACVTSQFEQQLRVLCGLEFGSVDMLSPVVMTNLLGDLWERNANGSPQWNSLFKSTNSKLHLYGKSEARIGRKMGHFNTLASTVEEAENEASKVFSALSVNDS